LTLSTVKPSQVSSSDAHRVHSQSLFHLWATSTLMYRLLELCAVSTLSSCVWLHASCSMKLWNLETWWPSLAFLSQWY
jgi:hypothetical protein